MLRKNFNKDFFLSRIKRIYDMWRSGKNMMERVDCFMCVNGGDEENMCAKSIALQIWLFGSEIPNTIFVFCATQVNILTTNEDLGVLQLQNLNFNQKYVLKVKLSIVYNISDYDEKFSSLKRAMKNSRNGKVVGIISKNDCHGEICKMWFESLKSENFKQLDMSSDIAYLMAVKDNYEINIMRKASMLSVNLFYKFLVDKIMFIIDSNLKVRHSKISHAVIKAQSNQKYTDIQDKEDVELSYPPIIKSDSDSFKFTLKCDNNYLHFGVIVCSLGIRFKSYYSNITRTLLVNPSQDIQNKYNILLDIHGHVLKLLQPNAILCDIYKQIIAYVENKYPEMIKKLSNSFGFAMGLKFKENAFTISKNCNEVAKEKMTFNVFVGLSGLENKAATDDKDKIYELFVADTVLVTKDPSARILTVSKKLIRNIGIFFEDSQEHEEVVNTPLLRSDGRRNAVYDSRLRDEMNAEDRRKRHQRELGDQLNRSAKKRLVGTVNSNNILNNYCNEIDYKFPSDMKELKIFVDKKYETVVIPIFGMHVPFHISTIKNISQSGGGGYTHLRINFFHPGSTINKKEVAIYSKSEFTYLKEVTYRSSNYKPYGNEVASSNLTKAFYLIKEVQKEFKTREAAALETQNLVQQGTLKEITLNAPKLRDLYIRPNICTKHVIGRLEAHNNGFRFRAFHERGTVCVDILYNNIKSAFYQPSDGELIILLHLHLKHAIMIGKKKSFDVQFYREVGEITTDLAKNTYSRDQDDFAAEERERETRKRLSETFEAFIEKIEYIKHKVVFEKPLSHLKFLATPFRSTVSLQPTLGSLVNLTEWPPFIITLVEVELVHFERVSLQLKTFDMTFIFKDYCAKVVSVNNIPVTSLDQIKDWLNSCDIRYSEANCNLNWPKIMRMIVDDPESFFANGGWKFLDLDQSDDESCENDEDDSYEPSQSDLHDDDYGDVSEYSDISESSVNDNNLKSDEESGKDWSDLEQEAAEHDRKKDSYLNQQNRNENSHYNALKRSRRFDSPSTRSCKRSRY